MRKDWSVKDWQRMYAEIRGLDPVTLMVDPEHKLRIRIRQNRIIRKEAIHDTGL